MATPLPSIECSAQPLSISFHPYKEIVAAGLVDGTIEIHDLIAPPLPNLKEDSKNNNDDDDDMDSDSDNDNEDEVADTILASITVAKEVPQSKMDTKMLAKSDSTSTTSKATQGPSCRCVLFSNSPNNNNESDNNKRGGEYIYTACNNGSLKCLDSELACNSLNQFHNNKDNQSSNNNPILWSIDNAHNVGINKIYQLPHSSPCGAAIVTGDDIGTVRLWDTRICGNSNNNQNKSSSQSSSNPFDNLMKLPTGCIQHWKVNHDYITDFETNVDGTTLFASSADGTLSVFDIRYINKKGGTSRSISLPDIDLHQPISLEQKNNTSTSTWEKHGYVKSDNQEDELLSLVLLKNSTKLLCGSQQGILSLFSYNIWGDISDRFPGHPHSIDALLKIDEDTVLTGSSDGLVRCVQLLPNALLGVLGSHDGFPIEGLGWSCGRNMVGSISHDEYIRLWDASLLKEDDDDDDDDNDEGNMVEDGEDDHIKSSKISNKTQVAAAAATTTTKSQHDDSEDDWEDMDEDRDRMDSDDDDDSDSDSDDGGGGGKQKKREPIFKSDNDAFFSDL